MKCRNAKRLEAIKAMLDNWYAVEAMRKIKGGK